MRSAFAVFAWCLAFSFAASAGAEPPDNAPPENTADQPPQSVPGWQSMDLPDEVPRLLEMAHEAAEALAAIRDPKYRGSPEEKAAREARRARGLTANRVEAALDKLHDTATAEERRLSGFNEAMDLRLVFRTIMFSDGPRLGTEQQKAELMQQIELRLREPDGKNELVSSAAQKVAVWLDLRGEPEQALNFHRTVGALLIESPNQELRSRGEQLLATARRIELVGQPFELSGTLLDGTELDWSQYRGKIVLVEFWATWCGACLREFPELERRLAKYRTQGFEIVGVNLDEDRSEAEAYLAKHPLPWPNLYDAGLAERSLAKRFGITGGLSALLVGRDGRVLNVRALGAELDRELTRLLGQVESDTPSESQMPPETPN